MPDRLDEMHRRAMLALRSLGRDALDAGTGEIVGIQARIGDVVVCSTDDTKLYVRVESLGKVAYKENDKGYVTVLPEALDAALENLRLHQVLDDLAGA